MKILVTGAAGFLGSHICDSLLNRGHLVCGVDNFFRGSIKNLPVHHSFNFHEIDLLECNKLQSLFNSFQPELVIHYAAINGTRYFYDIPYRVCHENILMTQNVLKVSSLDCVKKIVFASSSEVYGPTPLVPTAECQPIILHQSSDRDSYASSKAIGEFLVRLWANELKKSFLILRPFNTYGERMATNGYGQVIPEFIERIISKDDFFLFGDGNQTRSFCHVFDHSEILCDLIFSADNETLNIGNDEEITILDLAKLIHFKFNKPFNPSFKPSWDNDTKWRKPDLTNLKKFISDRKFIDLAMGISKMIK
jgi:nucleoside-diphosphate-sugar epimerase